MKTIWMNEGAEYDLLIMAGDVGGTNTNLAMVGEKDGKFNILLECVFKTQEVKSFIVPFKDTITEFQTRFPGIKPAKCCVSGAGPVRDNVCRMTNASWQIDGNKVFDETGIRCQVINDFTAISYGVLLLDPENPEQITRLPRVDGEFTKPSGPMRAIVGAGTGLGVGFVAVIDGKPVVFPSEGGHQDFSAFDEDSRLLQKYLSDKFGEIPDYEKAVSGPGLVNMFYFFRDVKKISMTGAMKEINEAPDDEKPKLISKNSFSCPECRQLLQFFIRAYARIASSVAVTVQPKAGLYLAGGIVGKDEPHYLADNCFMNSFEYNVVPGIRDLLKTVPVYIVRDYTISIYGAANAAKWLIED